jgi:flagellar biosynthesis/type III secretory pathway chaperone
VDADTTRDCLASLLSDEAAALRQFEELLEREHDALVARDMEKIEGTARLRQERVGVLARIEEQRRSVCTMHGHPGGMPGLEALMRACDPQGSVLPLLRDCAARAIRCRDLNDRNGALVAALLQHVGKRLAVLTGQPDSGMLYGPRGSIPASQGKRALGAA